LDEADESETGSANLWSGPRKGAGRFLGPCLRERLVGGLEPRHDFCVEPDDIRLLFEVLFDIRQGVQRTVWLLESDDEDEEEEDS
jgi:hypothetical protein